MICNQALTTYTLCGFESVMVTVRAMVCRFNDQGSRLVDIYEILFHFDFCSVLRVSSLIVLSRSKYSNYDLYYANFTSVLISRVSKTGIYLLKIVLNVYLRFTKHVVLKGTRYNDQPRPVMDHTVKCLYEFVLIINYPTRCRHVELAKKW